jgi:hypothetical protein
VLSNIPLEEKKKVKCHMYLVQISYIIHFTFFLILISIYIILDWIIVINNFKINFLSYIKSNIDNITQKSNIE